MKDVQSDNRTFAGYRPTCYIICAFKSRLKKTAIIFCAVLSTLTLLLSMAYSQDTMSQYYNTPSVNPYFNPGYHNTGYGYTVGPMQGLYYSGHSPMMQPSVTMPQYSGYPSYPNTAHSLGTGQYANIGQQNANRSDYAEPPQTIKQQPTVSGYSQYMPLRSPLLETGWETVKLLSPFNAPDGPHRGVGTPLEDQSWLDRPWYAGVFGGWVGGSQLIQDEIDQGSGSNVGVLLGKNLNHYWGLEGRFFGSSMNIKDISDSSFPAPERSNQLTALDLSVHYYPYGEAKWRPYFKLGIGYARQSFTGNYGESHNLNTCTIPFGGGLKYWWSDRVNVFGEVVDNMILGKGPTRTQSNWALNFGVNFTFGSNPNYHPTVYWPQSPVY